MKELAMPIHVVPVERRGGSAFHSVRREVYSGTELPWTPALYADEAARFSIRSNPSLVGTEHARWIAVAGRRPVGRIAAFAPSLPQTEGYFGFFESVDDPIVATALLRAAEAWLEQHGKTRIYGPIAINPRDEIGLLIDGFDSPGALLTPYNPPYYARLLESAGYQPKVHLRAYAWRPDMADVRGILPLGERLTRRAAIRIRTLDPGALEEEAVLVSRLMNQAFAHVWGYVPVTEAEAHTLARQLRPILDPNLCFVAEQRGRPCGVALTVPDANWLIRRIGGRLWPLGWLHALRLRRRIPCARIMALAALPGARHAGTAVSLLVATHRALKRGGYSYAEGSQVFDDNHLMRRLLERMGCPVVKRYAVFERDARSAR
jgi:GNAT superfamily N-acetyltransferase